MTPFSWAVKGGPSPRPSPRVLGEVENLKMRRRAVRSLEGTFTFSASRHTLPVTIVNAGFNDILALVCAIAGWFYLFYSRAASRLSGIESSRRNTVRVVLRRVCGGALFLLAVGFFAGFHSIDENRFPGRFVAVWMGVMLLLLLVVSLVSVDLVLTWKLRRRGGASNAGEKSSA
jgi:hypothetical protein